MDADSSISFKECAHVMFKILRKMRLEGLLSMEQHIEAPQESPFLKSIAGSPEESFLCECFDKYVILGFPDENPGDIYFPVFLSNDRCVFMYTALRVALACGEPPRECLSIARESIWNTAPFSQHELDLWINEWETAAAAKKKDGVYRELVGHA